MNERKTEQIVRKFLQKFNYSDNSEFIIEEQKSDNPIINKLLKTASKKRKWGWVS